VFVQKGQEIVYFHLVKFAMSRSTAAVIEAGTAEVVRDTESAVTFFVLGRPR
jgi:hypothetical protein